ncbi:MAG: RNA-binding S4 domain-containing protein [Pseudolabrys sp.]|nr:RNA-binding S4 domain-containing protein [Pseudolabrys sp.]
MDRQRIDKWLWHARTVRTRTDAASLVSSGHVRVNGQKVKAPGHALKIGDVLTVALDRTVRILEVTGFADRRGGAPEARTTYLDRSTDQPPNA